MIIICGSIPVRSTSNPSWKKFREGFLFLMTQILAQANDQDGMKIFLAGINDIGIFLPFENEVIIL